MSDPGEPAPRTQRTRREQAIAHAADLLREGGPTALTSVAVAERLGVTQSAVYRHVRNMDELSELAAESVVAELNQTLHDILFDPATDWDDLDDIGRLCRELVDSMIRNQRSFAVVAQWRFVDGPLGTGIRKVIEDGCEVIATLLETRWRLEFGHDAPLSAADRTALDAHARAIHENAHAVASLAVSPSSGLATDDVAGILRHRIIAGWVSFVIDMNARVGLAFPTIDLGPPVPTDSTQPPETPHLA